MPVTDHHDVAVLDDAGECPWGDDARGCEIRSEGFDLRGFHPPGQDLIATVVECEIEGAGDPVMERHPGAFHVGFVDPPREPPVERSVGGRYGDDEAACVDDDAACATDGFGESPADGGPDAVRTMHRTRILQDFPRVLG